MDQTAQSLKQQILNVTTAVDEASLNQRLNALQTRYLSLDEIDEDEESTASSSEQEQDISFDDADILDTEAYEKVIELCAKKSRDVGIVSLLISRPLETVHS
jgi:hypothetical protein